MSMQPLSKARDADLRFSQQAMDRAALRARQLAAQTKTDLIVSRNGAIERLDPAATAAISPNLASKNT